MPLILVVEQDLGVVSRLRRAFSEEEGWRVQHVRSAEEVVDRVGSEAPDLFVVSAEIGGAERILGTYARRRGGPGTLALVAEGSGPGADPLEVAGWGADAVVSKPITEETVREAAEGILKAGDRPAAAVGGDESKLTSNDIFGDLVAEVERDEERQEWKRPAPAAPREAPPAQGAPADRPPLSAPRQPPAPTSRGRTARPSFSDEDIERRLERTLSGVLPGGVHGKTPKAPKAPEALSPPGSTPKPARSAEADLDALISKTLSGLEMPKRKKPAAASPSAGHSAEVLDALEAAGLTSPSSASPRSPRVAAPADRPAEPPVPSPEPGRLEEPGQPEPEQPDEVELELSELELPVIEAPVAEEEAPLSSLLSSGTDIGAPVDAPGQAASEQPHPPRTPLAIEPPDIPFRPKFADTFEEVAEPVAGMDLDEEAPALVSASPEPSAASPEAAPAGRDAEGSGEGVAFGQYRLLERIGVGGMAEVWKARMSGVEGFQKIVAIKKILPHLTDSSDFVEMFIDEAKLAAQLNHANIIHIYDLGKIDGDYYIAMEYVEGENLRAILNTARDQGRPLPVGLALFIAARLASALDHAHRKRDFEDRSLDLVHRDVSPQNVLVGYEGTIKLCDFGIVKAVSKSSHTRMGALKGKLQYMSPEQAWGRSVDARSDIFAVGILLFEMLTGRRLFRGESEMEVLEVVRECRVQAPGEVDPSVSRDVDAIVLKALSKDPEERYQSAGELARRLEEALVSMRPSPGQPELADYMGELFERGRGATGDEGTGSAELAAAGEMAGGTASLTGPSPGSAKPGLPGPGPQEEMPLEVVAPEPVAPSPPVPAEPEPIGLAEAADDVAAEPPLTLTEDQPAAVGTTPRSAAGTTPRSAAGRPPATGAPSAPADLYGGPAAEAVEPVSEIELEEGGRGGKGLLVGAIFVALLVAALLYWFVWRPRMSGERTAPPSAGEPVEQTQGSAPGPFAPTASDLGEQAALTGSGPRAFGETGEAVGDAAPVDPGAEAEADHGAGIGTEEESQLSALVERSLNEEMAQQEEELRRQFEAKERGLAERLAAAQKRAAEPAPKPKAAAPPAPNAGKPAGPSVPEPAPERRGDGGSEGVRPAGAGREDGGADAASLGKPPVPAATAAATVAEDRAAEDGPRALSAPKTEPEAAASPSPKPSPREPEPEPVAEPVPPPATSVAVGDLVDMGPGVTPPQLVSISKPEYPPVARRLRVEGTVVVSLLVSEDGDVLDTRLDQGVSRKVGLNEAALEAARRAKYRPATKDGVRVKMWTTLKIPFRL